MPRAAVTDEAMDAFLVELRKRPVEQKAFEQALQSTRSLPPAERWAAVAELVPGKSKGDCIARVSARSVSPINLRNPLSLVPYCAVARIR